MKLREVIKGYAKRLDPFLMTNTFNDVWKALKSAFGDLTKLMQNWNDYHLKLGILSIDNAKGGLMAKVERFLKLKVILKSIKE